MKKETWIVVANSALARIFRLEGQKLVEMETMIHPEARMAEKDLVSDKSGLAGEAHKGRHSAYSPQFTAKQVENTVFAKKVSDLLEHARNQGDLVKIYLAAGPDFLGRLRNEMSIKTQSLIAAEVNKDITHLKPQDIKNHFPIGL